MTSIKQDVYRFLVGIAIGLSVIFALMINQSYHTGLNESARYGFLYELAMAERQYLDNGTLPQSPTLQIYLQQSQLPKPFINAFDWDNLQPGNIAEHYLESPNSGQGKFLYASVHQFASNRWLVVSEYDEALYWQLLEQHPPESLSQVSQGMIVSGFLLLLVFAAIRILVKRLTAPVMTLHHWSKTLDLDQPLSQQQLRYRELVQLAQQLQQSVEQQQQAVQRETFFLRAASHELRTPLATLSASSALLNRISGTFPASGQRAVARIIRTTNSMSQLVNGLLWMNHQSDDNSQATTPLTKAIDDEIANLENLLLSPPQIQLLTDTALELPELPLRIVLHNLLRNAAQHGNDINIIVRQQQLEITNQCSDDCQQPGFGIGLTLVDKICTKQQWEWQHHRHQQRFVATVRF